jgi:8-oxo-dGTP pyrophosphatase MutT (NUDIX family)
MSLAARLRTALDRPSSSTWPTSDDYRLDEISDFRDAAVLIAITDRPEPGVLLTLRTEKLRSHAGQVALPGGRVDPGDEHAIAAALREAEEEIGLDGRLVEIVGEAEQYRTGTGFLITPVIGVVPPDLQFTPHEHEVAAIFEAPLAHLLDRANYAEQKVFYGGRDRSFLETYWAGYRIWGATAEIFRLLSHRLEDVL